MPISNSKSKMSLSPIPCRHHISAERRHRGEAPAALPPALATCEGALHPHPQLCCANLIIPISPLPSTPFGKDSEDGSSLSPHCNRAYLHLQTSPNFSRGKLPPSARCGRCSPWPTRRTPRPGSGPCGAGGPAGAGGRFPAAFSDRRRQLCPSPGRGSQTPAVGSGRVCCHRRLHCGSSGRRARSRGHPSLRASPPKAASGFGGSPDVAFAAMVSGVPLPRARFLRPPTPRLGDAFPRHASGSGTPARPPAHPRPRVSVSPRAELRHRVLPLLHVVLRRSLRGGRPQPEVGHGVAGTGGHAALEPAQARTLQAEDPRRLRAGPGRAGRAAHRR